MAYVEVNGDNSDWHKPIDVLIKQVYKNKLERYISSDASNLDDCKEIIACIAGCKRFPNSYRFVHWINEEWGSMKINKNDLRHRSSLGRRIHHYNLMEVPTNQLSLLLNDFKHLILNRFYYHP